MKENIILLSARKYAMADEKTGEVQSGISCYYVMPDSLSNVDKSNGYYGAVPLKGSVSLECAAELDRLPGLYEGSFEMASVSNRIVLKLRNIKRISNLSLVED